MSEFETEITEPGLDQQEVQPDSIMEALRQKHQALKDRKTLDLPIPGYDGDLIARYRMVGLKELEMIGNKIQREFKTDGDRIKYSAMDALVHSCEGFFYNRDGELVGLERSLGEDEPPIRYDDRLVTFLGLKNELGEPPTRAREVVLALFGGNDLAIVDHSNTIGRWISDTSKQVTEEFLGER